MTGYRQKRASFSHDRQEIVRFTLEVDVTGDGTWHPYTTLAVPAGQTLADDFPTGYSAHWVRVRVDKDCTATAWFTYAADAKP